MDNVEVQLIPSYAYSTDGLFSFFPHPQIANNCFLFNHAKIKSYGEKQQLISQDAFFFINLVYSPNQLFQTNFKMSIHAFVSYALQHWW